MFPKTAKAIVETTSAAMVGLRYRHKKTRGTYRVMCVARMEATLELAVVYVSEKDQVPWVRPLAEFVDGRFAEIKEA